MKNERFEQFRAQLDERGFLLRALWGGKSHPDERYEDVTCYSILSTGDERPAIGTIVIRHYDEGRNGFGIWFESRSAEIAADVRTIIGEQSLAERIAGIIRVGTGDKERDAALAGAKLEDIKRLLAAEGVAI